LGVPYTEGRDIPLRTQAALASTQDFPAPLLGTMRTSARGLRDSDL